MGFTSRHLSIHIDRPAAEVYDFAADPRNLRRWAAGLAGATVEYADGRWHTDSPMGRVSFRFVPRNDLGVLDHDVRLPSGETVRNPMRVLPDDDGCEVVFTLRQRPGMTDEEYAADVAAVERDLATLRTVLEQQ